MSEGRPIRTPAGVINVEGVDPARPAAGSGAGAGAGSARSGPVRARVSNIDTWSVMRTAFVLSIAIAVVILVAVLVLWGLFEVTGVWDAVSRATDGVFDESSNVDAWFSLPRVMLVTVVVGVVEVVLTTAALTLLASLYNVAGSWVGGLEITLTDEH